MFETRENEQGRVPVHPLWLERPTSPQKFAINVTKGDRLGIRDVKINYFCFLRNKSVVLSLK